MYQDYYGERLAINFTTQIKKTLLGIAGLAVLSGPVTVGILNPARILAQSSDTAARPSFEVASIKVNKSGTRQASFEMSPGGERLVVRNWPLSALILRAYDVSQNQVSGNPLSLSLLRELERYDLEAKADHPVSRSEMMRMLQTLLADRFQLRLHGETREVSGYALEIAEGGSKLSEHTGPPVGDCAGGRGNDGEFTFQSCTMSLFASQVLTGITGGAFVADKTGLQGSYDFRLTASWELSRPPNPAEYPDAGNSPRIVNPGAPSIFTALPEQLGLKLERQRVQVRFIYIDHAEKPSGN